MFFARRGRGGAGPNASPPSSEEYRVLEGAHFEAHVRAQRDAFHAQFLPSSAGQLSAAASAASQIPPTVRLAEYLCNKRSELDAAGRAEYYDRVYGQCKDPTVLEQQPPRQSAVDKQQNGELPWTGAVPNTRFHTWTISRQERCVSCRFSAAGEDLALLSQDSVVLIHSTDCWKPLATDEAVQPEAAGSGSQSSGAGSRNGSWLGLGTARSEEGEDLFTTSGSVPESRGSSDDDAASMRAALRRNRTASLVASGRLQNVGFSLLDVCWATDGVHVAVCGWDTAIVLCRRSRSDPNSIFTTRAEIPLDGGLDNDYRGLCAFSIAALSSSLYALGTNTNRALVVDATRSACVHDVPHLDDVNAVASLGSSCFLSGSDDCLIKLSDLRTPNTRTGFTGHAIGVTSLDVCPLAVGAQTPYFVSNAKDQTAKVWDLRKGRVLASIAAEKEVHQQLHANAVRWDYRYGHGPPPACCLRPDRSLLTLFGSHTTAVTLCRARFSPTGRHVVCGGAEGTFTVYSLFDQSRQTVRAHDSVVRDVAWHPTLPLVATASWDGQCSLYCANEWTSHPAAAATLGAPTPQDLSTPLQTGEQQQRILLGDFFVTRYDADQDELQS